MIQGWRFTAHLWSLSRRVLRVAQVLEAIRTELPFIQLFEARKIGTPLTFDRCAEVKPWIDRHQLRIERSVEMYGALGYTSVRWKCVHRSMCNSVSAPFVANGTVFMHSLEKVWSCLSVIYSKCCRVMHRVDRVLNVFTLHGRHDRAAQTPSGSLAAGV